MANNQQDLRLLPAPFKKVAFGLMTLSILLIILAASKLLSLDKEIDMTIAKIGLLISLLMLALTKNKVEDELTIKLRLKALASSFIFGTVYVIAIPLVNLLLNETYFTDKGATEVIIAMLLYYFLIFYTMLKKR
jgi:hypothetical protein